MPGGVRRSSAAHTGGTHTAQITTDVYGGRARSSSALPPLCLYIQLHVIFIPSFKAKTRKTTLKLELCARPSRRTCNERVETTDWACVCVCVCGTERHTNDSSKRKKERTERTRKGEMGKGFLWKLCTCTKLMGIDVLHLYYLRA